MKASLIICWAMATATLSFGQAVCLGTEEACWRAQADLCAKPAVPNLDLGNSRILTGTVKDAAGAVLVSKGTTYVVQLRVASTGQVMESTSIDSSGRFWFGVVGQGVTRLIVVRMVDGVAKRFGFSPPVALRCNREEVCELNILLLAGPTDNLEDLCPLK